MKTALCTLLLSVLFTANAQGQSLSIDSDGDGVTDNVEWLAPGGDGNEDGRFDALQNDVVSLSYPESNLRGSSRQQTLSNIELRVGEQASGFRQVQVLPKLTATEVDPNGAIAPLQFVRSGRSALVQIKYAGEYFSDDARFYWLGRPGATGVSAWINVAGSAERVGNIWILSVYDNGPQDLDTRVDTIRVTGFPSH